MAVVFPSENHITQQLPSLRRNPAYTEGRVISDIKSGHITTLHRERELKVLVAGDSSDEDEELKSKPRTVTSPVEYSQPNRQVIYPLINMVRCLETIPVSPLNQIQTQSNHNSHYIYVILHTSLTYMYMNYMVLVTWCVHTI